MSILDETTMRHVMNDLGYRADEGEQELLAALLEANAEALTQFTELDNNAREPVNLNQRSATPRVAGDDPLNAIRHDVHIEPTGDGLLTGLRVGIKEQIAIAGVPMSCGSRLLADFIPREDSVLTRRVLEHGGQITASLNMDAFATSGGGETSDFGPVRNPYDPQRATGGSSAGSAAALHYDRFELTYGSDQGGSVRIPAAWCGVLGIKPTWSLIPYTGAVSLDRTFDHLGVFARDTLTMAKGLEAVAGYDESDSRQHLAMTSGGYVDAVETALAGAKDLAGIRIGIITEGISDDLCEPEVRAGFAEVSRRLQGLGATIDHVSVPQHLSGGVIFFGMLFEGLAATLDQHGIGYHAKGRRDVDFAKALQTALDEHPTELPATTRFVWLVGRLLNETYGGTRYGIAQNLAPGISAGYDEALRQYDVLMTPTTTRLPYERIQDVSVRDLVMRGWSMLGNCPSTDLTGHPALTIPLGVADGLPFGTQLIGRHFDDGRLLEIAARIEKHLGWDLPISAGTNW